MIQPTKRSIVPATGRRYTMGAEFGPDGRVSFRVWAPKRRRVELFVPSQTGSDERVVELAAELGGYFSGEIAGASVGLRYGFRLDGEPTPYADPASRFQPDGPVGLSELIDPAAFRWSDGAWPGVSDMGQVIYEMHLGTFTREGTWAAAAEQLAELRRIGITVLEVMPVADFPGQFGWGYDGVAMFAPTRLYGRPDDFRRFVDRAHAEGLGVILDVVYNHFGSIDNNLGQFSDDYTTDRYENEWAEALNFDGETAGPVREFFLTNVRYWIEEFHIDGYRFDATQQMFDASPAHILAELSTVARRAGGQRSVYLVAENEPQQVQLVKPVAQDGYGLSAMWNDDFHHSATVRLTNTNRAYYSDYLGDTEELLSCVKHGLIYQGQVSQWQHKPRGTPTDGMAAQAFVTFLQNHDQVANSASGLRIDRLTSPGRLRAMTTLWLLMPQTPMFFQGQEFAASSPFLFFADYAGEIGDAVAKGRAEFLSQFPPLATEEGRSGLARPSDLRTFHRCKLDFAERETHRPIYDVHGDLLALRRDDPVFHLHHADLIDTATIGTDVAVLRYRSDDPRQRRLLVVNFGRDVRLSPVPQPLFAPPVDCQWKMIFSSDSLRYGGGGTGPLQLENGWHLPGEAAVVLAATPQTYTE